MKTKSKKIVGYNRRSNEICGFVNFPVNDKNYENSNEGGMFVKLVVINDGNWSVCCGPGDNVSMFSDVMIDDDKPKKNVTKPKHISEFAEKLELNKDNIKNNITFHYPRIDDDICGNLSSRYMSIPYLAIIDIGSTDWSGWNEKKKQYWHCTFDDLKDDGKALYNSMKKLYPKCDIRLVTFLDT